MALLPLARLVAQCTRNSDLPFILAADFNSSCQKVGDSDEALFLKSSTLSPTNGTITCKNTSRDGGTAIDYLLVSDKLKPYVCQVLRDTEVPWKPHCQGARHQMSRIHHWDAMRKLLLSEHLDLDTLFETSANSEHL